MTDYPFIEGHSFYIVGLARTGLAAMQFLSRRGANVLVWDDKVESHPTHLPKNTKIAAPDIVEYEKLSGLLLSPGIPHDKPSAHITAKMAQKHAVPIISDISIFAACYPLVSHIAITGTNGKSTCCHLLHHCLQSAGEKAHLGGNIGNSILEENITGDLENDKDKDTETVISLELSSYQIERLHPFANAPAFSPDIAILLNIAPDHLDRHGDLKGYIAAKKKLLQYLAIPPHDKDMRKYFILAIDDMHTQKIYDDYLALTPRSPFDILPVSGQQLPKGGVGILQGKLIDAQDGQKREICTIDDIPSLSGAHNAQNIAAAYTAMKLYHKNKGKKFTADIFHTYLKNFVPLPHRQQFIGSDNAHNITFIDDSKATNSSSTLPALKTFTHIYWLAGGRVKENDFSCLFPYMDNVKQAYFFGEDADILMNNFQDKITAIKFINMNDAFIAAYQHAIQQQKDKSQKAIILLSPAAASFDQFKDFVDRGKKFQALALKYL